MNGNSRNGRRSCPVKLERLVKTGMLLLLFFYGNNYLDAQCTLVCNSPLPSSPANVAVDQNCEAVLTADMIIEDPGSCPGPKFLEVRTLAGNLVVEGPEPVTVPSAYLGNTLGVTVIDVGTWNECTGYIQISDNLAPMFISCENVEVSCIAGTDPAYVGYPIVEDNCDPDVNLTFYQTQTGPDCTTPSPYIGTIVRTWIATDNSNNQNTCTQTISLLKADINDVVFPGTVTQDCDNPDTSPDVTGKPTLEGIPIEAGNICMFTANYSDVIIYTCLPATHSYTIIRTWMVMDGCSDPNEIKTKTQNINVSDQSVPEVSCQPMITAGTNSNSCTGTVLLPPATASDNCSAAGDISITVITSYGGQGLGPHYNVPAGNYTVTYSAIDECGNIGTCVSNLQITDDDPPVAVCDEYTVVAITSGGTAVVPAYNLDDGSYDNCGPVTFKGSRNGGITFSENLTFTCADIGIPVNVILRVYAANNPASYNSCAVVVDVMDNLAPAIICPENETIDCIATYPFDLSQFGTPLVGDNCTYTLSTDTTNNINNCGEGVILRHFTVTDPSGNTATCTQTLTVSNLTPFNGTQILWPPDYTTNECITADQLDPEDLPSSPVNYNAPLLPDVGCTLLATNYSDQVFLIAYPACYKIVRTWSVMDWCNYNPSNPGQGGIWTYKQLIIVMDNTAPEFVNVPSGGTYPVGANCQFGEVILPVVTATDCSPFVTITNDSPYAYSGGANASGMYPLGVTTVNFSAKDGCGNTSVYSVTITVADLNPPAVFCVDLVAELGEVQGEIWVEIFGTYMLEVTYDDCTAYEDIGVFIRRRDPSAVGPPSTPGIIFTCDDIGANEVEIWVVDEAGNADYCIENVYIQDNLVICPPNAYYTIAGAIETEQGDEVDEVTVQISGSPDTSQIGSPFVFLNQPSNYDYTITPVKEAAPGNGVTTYDLVLMSRHILGVQQLDSPYKVIAADANRTGSVTTADMVAIRKVILGIENAFPGNPSWRFVDKDYLFADPANPFAEPFPEVISINNLSSDHLFTDFVAVKTGDVNGSASPNQMTQGTDLRNFDGAVLLTAADRYVEQGNDYEIAFYGQNFNEIMGMQFALNLDPEKLQWLGTTSCDLPNLGSENFGENRAAEGRIPVSWNTANGVTLSKDDCLFAIQVRALQNGNIQEWIEIDPERLRAEAYQAGGNVLEVRLQANTANEEGLVLYQNRPNPFNRSTIIGFSVDRPVQGALVVYDLSGKEVFRHTGAWDTGYYEYTLGRDQLPGIGMYYYKLETDAITEVRKMVLID